MTIIKKTIGENAYKIIDIGRQLLNEELNTRYRFVTPEELKETLKKSSQTGNQIYWMEMFYRCHMSSYSGIKRLLDWVDLVENSSGNFISYCSGLRGLMECAGDTYDGLSAVAITLGENKEIIKKAISGNLKEILLNEELEQKLIHFTHASKPYAKETGLSYHKPKQSQEYVKALEIGSTIKFYDYYSFLCELAHPAGTSLGFNFDETAEGEMVFNHKRDKSLVENALQRDKDLIIELLMRGFNPTTLLIKTINLFKIEGMYSKYADGIVLNIPAWKRINK